MMWQIVLSRAVRLSRLGSKSLGYGSRDFSVCGNLFPKTLNRNFPVPVTPSSPFSSTKTSKKNFWTNDPTSSDSVEPGESNTKEEQFGPETIRTSAERLGEIFQREAREEQFEIVNSSPEEVMQYLDEYIVGQNAAKRAVAVALRNRWRRQRLNPDIQTEIIPKNILMIGPTGVGKTEIARRLAQLQSSPFIKVEATKFTEVGFHGRDVDQIIRDLVEISIQQTRKRLVEKHRDKIKQLVDLQLTKALTGATSQTKGMQKLMDDGQLESREVEMEMPETPAARGRTPSGGGLPIVHSSYGHESTVQFYEIGSRSRKKKMTVAEWRPVLEQIEIEKHLNQDLIHKKAIEAVEQVGIVFIDEIDKICEPSGSWRDRPDASSEGVQRDLLPLIEGTIINTNRGNVDTSGILFIVSGAFHTAKPSDLLAELQGRLPIRVELQPFTEEDLYKILTIPKYNSIRQQVELLKPENIELVFTEAAMREIARIAALVNQNVENTGARRLHTIIEKVTEDVSFNCQKYAGSKYVIDKDDVRKHLDDLLQKTDLKRYLI